MTEVHAPLTREAAEELRAGEEVLISGIIYTARDAAHKKLCELLQKGEALPIDLEDAVLYYAGPTPPPPGCSIGSCGPTTASRMDRFTPRLLEEGLRGMIGKGHRSPEVVEAIAKNGAVFFAAEGGCGALLARCVRRAEVIAFPELGTEAIRRLIVENFPAVVAVDAKGSVYNKWTI
jgi:hydro-lyases, Fe-S type, tartrate/fumarate subfamily, beta region